LSVKPVPKRLAATIIEPAVQLLGRHPIRYRREERRGRVLALPIIGSGMPHLGTAGTDRVEHPHGGHQLTGTVYLDLHPATGESLDTLGKTISPRSQTRIVLRPGGHHAPLVGFAAIR